MERRCASDRDGPVNVGNRLPRGVPAAHDSSDDETGRNVPTRAGRVSVVNRSRHLSSRFDDALSNTPSGRVVPAVELRIGPVLKLLAAPAPTVELIVVT